MSKLLGDQIHSYPARRSVLVETTNYFPERRHHQFAQIPYRRVNYASIDPEPPHVKVQQEHRDRIYPKSMNDNLPSMFTPYLRGIDYRPLQNEYDRR
jgi:hypothetical protein